MPKDIQFVEQPPVPQPQPSKIPINEREEFLAAMEKYEQLVDGESPRAKVLIFTAAIDVALTDALRNFMVPSNQKSDTILESIAVSFESRIDLAFRLGMISHNMWRDLQIFRELRDDCIDRLDNFSFDNSAIQASVTSLIRNVGKQAFAGLPTSRMDTADRFSFLARLFLVTLENMRYSNKRLNEANKERLYTES